MKEKNVKTKKTWSVKRILLTFLLIGVILAVAFAASVIVFVTAYICRKAFDKLKERIDTVNVLFDALGLGAFSIAGIETTRLTLSDDKILLIVIIRN